MQEYRVWMENEGTFEKSWVCNATSPKEAAKKYRQEADPPGWHTWDDDEDEGNEVKLVVCRPYYFNDTSDEVYQGETWVVRLGCIVSRVVTWTELECEKVKAG